MKFIEGFLIKKFRRGRNDKAIEVAKNLLKAGIDMDIIVKTQD